jgi:phosphate:Na+ symporter
VFGANVGTTGTAWLVALFGVRISLSTYALPMIFAGSLARLLGRGRAAASGSALAGFALVLYGLTTLQQGMGGLAQSLHPSDLPAVLGELGVGWAAGSIGLLMLIAVGLAMTAVMQSSTAATAVTISAFFAGAISLEQGAALIIGQNIGTATSSALAAIGASTTAKRLAVAYVLFKIIAALIAVAVFPFTAALMRAANASIDGTTLLAAYHTAYNVVGVAVLLPATPWFTRVVERLLPEKKRTTSQRVLDPSALANPVIAVEATRRVVAGVLAAMARLVSTMLAGAAGPTARDIEGAGATLQEAWDFLSELQEMPETEAERLRMTSTLHALDHASRLVETLAEGGILKRPAGAAHDARIAALCTRTLHAAHTIGDSIIAEAVLSAQAAPVGWNAAPELVAVLDEAARATQELDVLRREHRAATLASVAPEKLTAAEAFARVDAARRLDRIAYHAWRSAAYLLGRGAGDA